MELNLTTMLGQSGLIEADNVARLIETAEQIDVEETLASKAELLTTYRARLAHLGQFSTHHATRLQRATAEFVAALEQLDDEAMIAHARIDDPILGGYVVWFVPSNAVAIGALYVIGRSEVPAEVWQSIWEDP
ncbi:MAG: hypothetical protein AAF513_02975 [Pseudomonadota bacterium]